MTSSRHDIIILSDSADAYARLLAPLLGKDTGLTVCHEPGDALTAYRGQEVLLGEPHLAAQVVDHMPGLRWVQSTWAGVRPLLDLGPRAWTLTGVKGVFGPPMSEYVVGCLLAHELKLPRRMEAQRQRAWDPVDSGSLHGKRAGVMGTGSIGGHIARVLQSFGVTVRGLNRSGREAPPFERVYGVNDLATFLAGLDYLVSALPETRATNRLLDAGMLACLPRHAVVVNVGRGNVVDEQALADALSAGALGGAALDVFETEPLPQDSPLWAAPGALITAHVAARSLPDDIAPLFAENFRQFIAGKPLQHQVDFERGY